MTQQRILVVDDNAENLWLTHLLLMGEGYAVQTAVDAEEALRVVAWFSPRVILRDLQLPGMDGLALTRQIKGEAVGRDVTILALTARAMTGDREKALAAGCDGYLSKPIDIDELLRTVADHVARRPAPDGGRDRERNDPAD